MPDGDPERFARLFDVVSRFAERQQNIESGRAAPLAAAPLGAAAPPGSPSTGSRASRDEAQKVMLCCCTMLHQDMLLVFLQHNGLVVHSEDIFQTPTKNPVLKVP